MIQRRSKYGNRKTAVDGITFDSAAEAKRYGELKILAKTGHIEGLKLQPKFSLHSERGTPICAYIGDFAYTDKQTGENICEDVKGHKTAEYKLKIKWARDSYPYIKFVELKA